MTRQADGVEERILACAREEFLEKGFSESSLRMIAAKAETTTGSIYSRFGGKEGLFAAIVEPAANYVIERFIAIQEAFHHVDEEKQPESMETYVNGGMNELLDYVYDNFETFQILLDASYGTKFQNFVERLVEIETSYTYKYMDVIHFPDKNGEMITEEFVHIMSKALFESMFEVVRHKMTKERAVTYMAMLSRYHNAGWGAILNDRPLYKNDSETEENRENQ